MRHVAESTSTRRPTPPDDRYNPPMRRLHLIALVFAGIMTAFPGAFSAQSPLTLTVQVDRPGTKIDPIFYGLMTEEINFSYDGGLYAELIRNRTFRDNPKAPDHWSLVKDGSGEGSIALENAPVPDTALTTALRLDVTAATTTARVGVANAGFWGIPVKPQTTYRASFYAKAS